MVVSLCEWQHWGQSPGTASQAGSDALGIKDVEPKSGFVRGDGGQGMLHETTWGSGGERGDLGLHMAWLQATVSPGIRATPKSLSRALWLFGGFEDGDDVHFTSISLLQQQREAELSWQS